LAECRERHDCFGDFQQRRIRVGVDPPNLIEGRVRRQKEVVVGLGVRVKTVRWEPRGYDKPRRRVVRHLVEQDSGGAGAG